MAACISFRHGLVARGEQPPPEFRQTWVSSRASPPEAAPPCTGALAATAKLSTDNSRLGVRQAAFRNSSLADPRMQAHRMRRRRSFVGVRGNGCGVTAPCVYWVLCFQSAFASLPWYMLRLLSNRLSIVRVSRGACMRVS